MALFYKTNAGGIMYGTEFYKRAGTGTLKKIQ